MSETCSICGYGNINEDDRVRSTCGHHHPMLDVSRNPPNSMHSEDFAGSKWVAVGAPKWYFNCTLPADMSEHEEDGFATEAEAMKAAEAYAFREHGLTPGYRVRLTVSQDFAGAPVWRRDWPTPSWSCNKRVDNTTMKRVTE